MIIMMAQVLVDGQVAPEFEIANGLRQGCVLAPTLFNLFFNHIVEQRRERCREMLGHVAIMITCMMTEFQVLFGLLPQPRPGHARS